MISVLIPFPPMHRRTYLLYSYHFLRLHRVPLQSPFDSSTKLLTLFFASMNDISQLKLTTKRLLTATEGVDFQRHVAPLFKQLHFLNMDIKKFLICWCHGFLFLLFYILLVSIELHPGPWSAVVECGLVRWLSSERCGVSIGVIVNDQRIRTQGG